MSSLLERIAARHAEPADQAQHLTKQLADVQHELDRMIVAKQVITQMLAEIDPTGGDIPVQAPTASTSIATGTSPGPGFLIPYHSQAPSVSELPADYQVLPQIVIDADGPLICKDICRAAGLSTESGPVETTRAKLNRLADRGRLRRTPAGSFTRSP